MMGLPSISILKLTVFTIDILSIAVAYAFLITFTISDTFNHICATNCCTLMPEIQIRAVWIQISSGWPACQFGATCESEDKSQESYHFDNEPNDELCRNIFEIQMGTSHRVKDFSRKGKKVQLVLENNLKVQKIFLFNILMMLFTLTKFASPLK